MLSFTEEKKGMSTKGGIVVLIIIVAIAFGGYKLYSERRALNSIEIEISNEEPPDIEIIGLSVPATMEFQNNSNYESTPLEITYQLDVNDFEIDNGILKIPRIPAGESETVIENIEITPEDVEPVTWETLETGSFEIKIKGKIETKLFFGLMPVSQTFENTYKIG